MSEQVKHTPGPWEVDIEDDHDSAGDLEITARGAVVINVLGSDSFACFDEDSQGWDQFPDEQIANARLVSAAPDLLAECECLLQVERGRDRPDGWVIERLEAAIAKARGT